MKCEVAFYSGKGQGEVDTVTVLRQMFEMGAEREGM